MNQTIERILKGEFDYERGGLDISVSRIEMELRPNELFTDSFKLKGIGKTPAQGYLFSSDLRMELLSDVFDETTTEIGFNYSALGLEEGDVLQGEIQIVSNKGEYFIPYVATVREPDIESSLGPIKNLFHFANLAKANWDEAVRLFYSENFIRVFNGNDKQYKSLYRGLSASYGNEQNVEEFLVAINKKKFIEYIPESNSITVSEPWGVVEEKINLTRNGWGYTYLRVETDADFVILDKDEINDLDFLGNFYSFKIKIDPEKMHSGNNYANVIFYNSFVAFDVKITAVKNHIEKAVFSKNLDHMRSHVDMLTFYEAFRTKKITLDRWLAETKLIVDHMLDADPEYLAGTLFRAQLLVFEERYNEAKWLLDRATNVFNAMGDYSSATYAYYLYLTALCNRDEKYIDEMTQEVQRIYNENPAEWRVAWLLLYLSEEFAVSASKKWLFIEEQMTRQCNSPMFYVEAVNMLLVDPSLLMKLSDFEIRVVNYMSKNDLLTDDIVMQFIYLAGKENTFRQPVFDILLECYRRYPSDETLTVMCNNLIAGNVYGEEYYDFFLTAIEHELKITGLYEYYMLSINVDREYDIPKMVYLYFSYECNLDWEHTAYLYARVIAKREVMPELYESYKDRCDHFASECIQEERINRDLAVIYRFLLPTLVLTDEVAKKLTRLIFTHKVTVHERSLTRVVIYQIHECVESRFPITDGVAYVPIYNKDYTILFEDAFGNRFYSNVAYNIERLIVPGKIATSLLPLVHDNVSFNIYAGECSAEAFDIGEDNRERYSTIVESHEVEEEYKSDIRMRLMNFYFDNDKLRELDEVLDNSIPENLTRRERTRTIKYMILRGMFDKALYWVAGYGVEGIEQKDLVKLCSRIIERGDMENDPALIRIAATVYFNGKYDEKIIGFLTDNYNGMTRNLRKIYKSAENFEMDLSAIGEKMLIEMLYSGYFIAERMDIYRKYVQSGPSERIRLAFLTQCSFDYFVKEQLMEGFVFEELTKICLNGEELPLVGKLAYLKYYAENKHLVDGNINGLIRSFLDELMKQGMYMSFFKEFLDKGAYEVNRFLDKTIVEYKTEPGKTVWIHYFIASGEDAQSEYVTEEMQEMYGGVHAKAFILFFGENLMYYITEDNGVEEMLTESGNISKSDISHDVNGSRFSEINDIVIAKTLGDYDAVNDMLYDYQKHEYVVKNFFTLQ